MNCPNCGAQVTPGSFCGNCGTQIPQQAAPSRCPNCGASDGVPGTFCSHCGTPIPQAAATYAAPAYPSAPTLPEKENIPLGMIGALIGAFLGAASIVLLYELNVIAAISGWLLALCTLKGYTILGKKLSTFGIIFSVILMLVMPFAAYLFSVSWDVQRELADMSVNLTLVESMEFVLDFIKSGEATADLIKDLGMLYLFVVLGAISTIVSAIRGK